MQCSRRIVDVFCALHCSETQKNDWILPSAALFCRDRSLCFNVKSQLRLGSDKSALAVNKPTEKADAGRRDASSVRLDRSPTHLLHRANQCASDVFSGLMTDKDLTPRQYAVLVTVSANEGLSQTGLVERTGIDRSTLADIVRRMLKKGLLQRRRTREDARAYAVKLTDEGWRVMKAADVSAQRADERILAALPAKQRDQLLDDLATLVDALSRLSNAPAP